MLLFNIMNITVKDWKIIMDDRIDLIKKVDSIISELRDNEIITESEKMNLYKETSKIFRERDGTMIDVVSKKLESTPNLTYKRFLIILKDINDTCAIRELHPRIHPHDFPIIKSGFGRRCNVCLKRNFETTHQCTACNYDECEECFENTKNIINKTDRPIINGKNVTVIKNGKTQQYTVTQKNGGKRRRTRNKASRKTTLQLGNKMCLNYRMGKIRRVTRKRRTARKRQNGGVFMGAPVGYSIPFGQRQPNETIMERATTAGGKRSRRNKRKGTRRNKRN